MDMDDSGAQAPSQGGWDGIDEEFLDDPLRMQSGDRSVAPPTPGTKADRSESQAPQRTLGQALAGQNPGTSTPSAQPSPTTAPLIATPNPAITVKPQPATPPVPTAPDPMAIARTAQRTPLSPAAPNVPPPAMQSVLGGIDQSKLPDFVNGVRSEVPGRGAEEAIGRIPTPPVAANHADLVKRESELSQPVDPRAVDPKTGKPMYKMGIGQRIIGTVANFANGFARNGQAPIYVGPGATNNRYSTDVEQRAGQLSSIEKQLSRQQADTEESRKIYDSATKQAYDQALAESKGQTAQAAMERADVAGQLVDVKKVAVDNAARFNEEKTRGALDKLEEQARRNDQMFALGKGNLELKQQIAELTNNLHQQQLANDKEKFTTGLDAKSLEAERKGRVDAINKHYHDHVFTTMFSDKNAEIAAVNADINARLAQLQGGASSGAPTGAPASPALAPAGPPKPQSHIFSRSAWAQANPKGNLQRAEEKARLSGFKVGD